MKKTFRKISALLMTIVMVLSMCTAVFAATKNTATITVNDENGNLLQGTTENPITFKYLHVIKPDPTKETGWAFIDEDNTDSPVTNAYKAAFGKDAQDIIKEMLVKDAEGKFTVDAAKLGKAQANVSAELFDPMTNSQEVHDAGVYLVIATQAGYTYNVMAAYVGFDEVVKDGEKFDYPSLKDAVLGAKRAPITITKIVSEADGSNDNVTKTGDILTYTVKTNVPYMNPTDRDRTFFVYDTLSGAEYVVDDEHQMTITNAGKVISKTINVAKDNKSFNVNLSDLIDDANSNAGNEIVITYSVKVTSDNDTITNTATAGHENGADYGSKTVNTYEGNITLTKTDDYEKESEKKLLAGAGFEVRKVTKKDDNTVEESDALTFIAVTDEKGKVKAGEYKYDPEGDLTEVTTKEDGTVNIKGLDAGTYKFKEVTAPKGYKLNPNDATAELTITETKVSIDKDGKATAILHQDTNMKDTKLGALPSTGGIGTYIFTIAGVVLMACAAGAFFISRKKSEE